MNVRRKVRENQRLVDQSIVDYMDGVAAGAADRAVCHTESDLAWYRKVAFDNLYCGEITQFLSGYMAGIDGHDS